MPICKHCGNHFPNRVWINNSLKLLNKRKFCLDCSPYGCHNTQPHPPNLIPKDIERKCSNCNRVYFYDKVKGHTLTLCNSCRVNHQRKLNFTKKCLEYKGSKCIVCGYDRCTQSLCFHHLDPKIKSFNIGGSHCRKWETIKKELDKTVLVCMNCHGEIHNGMIDINCYISQT